MGSQQPHRSHVCIKVKETYWDRVCTNCQGTDSATTGTLHLPCSSTDRVTPPASKQVVDMVEAVVCLGHDFVSRTRDEYRVARQKLLQYIARLENP